jgi:hypothetical protein
MKEKFVSRSDVPKTGWFLVDVSDTEAAAFTCGNCKFPHVRYVHELRHRQAGRVVYVGCVCAEHLTQDFATPRLRERTLRSLAGRRLRWPTLNWKRSHKGNLYLRKQGIVIVITRVGSGWAVSYKPSEDDFAAWTSVQGWHNTAEEAKLAAFDALYSPRHATDERF